MDVRSLIEEEIESVNALSFISVSPQGLTRVQQATKADSEMVSLKKIIQTEWLGTKH